MSSAGGWSKEIVCGDESSTGSTEEPQYILPPDSSDEDDEIRQEVLINNEVYLESKIRDSSFPGVGHELSWRCPESGPWRRL